VPSGREVLHDVILKVHPLPSPHTETDRSPRRSLTQYSTFLSSLARRSWSI
jgi:hypothetical protein